MCETRVREKRDMLQVAKYFVGPFLWSVLSRNSNATVDVSTANDIPDCVYTINAFFSRFRGLVCAG